MTSDIPMVKKAQPSGERRLRVRFAGDRRRYVLDLTGLIAHSRHFAPLMADADFAKIDIRKMPAARNQAGQIEDILTSVTGEAHPQPSLAAWLGLLHHWDVTGHSVHLLGIPTAITRAGPCRPAGAFNRLTQRAAP